MKKVLALLLLVLAASAATLDLTEPTGEYAQGVIPVSARFEAGETVTFELLKGGMLLETKQYSSPTTDYSQSFNVTEQGTYTVRARISYNGTDYENTTSFDVTSSRIYLTILSPVDKTYYDSVQLEAEATQDNSFLHDADVTVVIGESSYSLPEGQNSYRLTVYLTPGYYTADFTASKGGESEAKSVSFVMGGEVTSGNETEYLPGTTPMEIRRVSPSRAQYSSGEEMEVTIYLLDNQNERVAGADTAVVMKTPGGLEQQISLGETLVGGKTVYTVKYTFAEDGFYEVKATASKAGHKPAELYMPAIRVGEEAPELPEDVFCQYGMCIRVETPSETETYPDGTSVTMRVQLIEEAVRPIADAVVTASWGNTTLELDYDWNGFYENITGNLTQGDHIVTFTASKGGVSVSKNITLHVSPDHLVIAPINPVPGGNSTDEFTTMQVRITDQNGEIVTGVNVRVIVTTPLTGTHTVQLSRNTGTGYYESEYTFADTGQYTLRLVASKIGFVSTEMVYTFDAVVAEEGFALTEEDVVIAALIIGVLLIIATLWKALL